MEEAALDDIIDRLLDVRNGRPGKQVQLTEMEIRQLCLTAKEIFMGQPNLLELEAPIKICGAPVYFSDLQAWMPACDPHNCFESCSSRHFAGPVVSRLHSASVLPMLKGHPVLSVDRRRHPWAVFRPAEVVRVWRLPAGSQLPVPGGLR